VDWRERISLHPDVMGGKPVIRGTRLSVEYMLDLLAGGKKAAEIVAAWPGLTEDDIRACIAYGRDAVHAERVYGYRRPA